MNKTQDKFSLPAVTLSIFAAAAAERLPVCSSPRALLWQEVLAAVLLMILSALASRFWQSGPPKPAAWAAAFCLQVWLAVELAGTFWKALQICREEFSSLALLGFLPLLLWAGWQMPARAWGAPAQVLWWFVAVGSAVCLLGLARQMHWAGLFAQAAPQSTAFTVPVYAEYFRYRCSVAGRSGVVSACPFSQPLYKRRQRLAWHWCSVGHTRRGNCCVHGAPGHFPGWTRRCCWSG